MPLYSYPLKEVVNYLASQMEAHVEPHFDTLIKEGWLERSNKEYWERYKRERAHLSQEEYIEMSKQDGPQWSSFDSYVFCYLIDKATAVMSYLENGKVTRRFGPMEIIPDNKPPIHDLLNFRDAELFERRTDLDIPEECWP